MFRAPYSSGGWGWVDGGGGWLGVGGWGWGMVGGCPTHMCTCTHAHACTCMRCKHDNFNCKWPPPLGESMGIPYDVICTCACVCMCVHVHVCGGHILTIPHPHPPTSPPPKGGTTGISQNSIALELIKIFQFCLKI